MKFVFTMDDVFEQSSHREVYKRLIGESLPEDVIQMFLFITAKHVLLSYTGDALQGKDFVMHPEVKLGALLGELTAVMNVRYNTHETSVPFRMYVHDILNSGLVNHNRIRDILRIGNKLYRPCKVDIINPLVGVAYLSVE